MQRKIGLVIVSLLIGGILVACGQEDAQPQPEKKPQSELSFNIVDVTSSAKLKELTDRSGKPAQLDYTLNPEVKKMIIWQDKYAKNQTVETNQLLTVETLGEQGSIIFNHVPRMYDDSISQEEVTGEGTYVSTVSHEGTSQVAKTVMDEERILYELTADKRQDAAGTYAVFVEQFTPAGNQEQARLAKDFFTDPVAATDLLAEGDYVLLYRLEFEK